MSTELDPDAKTIIFSWRMTCCDSIVVSFSNIIFGLVAFILKWIARLTGGTIDLQSFWFPTPFFNFWKAKLHLHAIQIDGCKLRTTAYQDDAYMKFCMDATYNFWTLGFYGRCSSKANYGRWLDRHIVWVGKPPQGYNNQFRIFHVLPRRFEFERV